MNVAESIERIHNKSALSKMDKTGLGRIENHLKQLSAFLSCSTEQAVIFSVIFHQSMEKGDCSFNDLAEHLDISAIRMLHYKSDLDQLMKKRLIRAQDYNNRAQRNAPMDYYVPERIIDGVINNKLNNSFESFDNNFDFLIHLYQEMERCKEDSSSFENMEAEMKGSCRENQHLFTAKALLKSGLRTENQFILIFLAYRFFDGENDISISEAIEFLESDKHHQMRVRRALVRQGNELVQRNFVESVAGHFRNDNELNITDEGMRFLLGKEAQEYQLAQKQSNIKIKSTDIKEVKLFHNAGEDKELQQLKKALSPAHMDNVFKNMIDEGMKPSFTVLFYGAPGTGKTESVYQLARRSGKDIIPVDISSTKSMWFGESEKRIKKVFKDYREMFAKHGHYPILLFNEADAVLGKRHSQANTPAGQTLNAMQNIILQELEDFTGILIATTNLNEMLDKAFDRRFLYKIPFQLPDAETRQKILLDKIPSLPPGIAEELATTYELSGGQIDNVAKKCRIRRILEGNVPERTEIHAYCREETGFNTSKKLGFCK